MASKIRIVVAEARQASPSVLPSMLLNWGFDVAVAHDGAEAWALLQSEAKPQIAILDAHLPGIDAIEICRRVRSANGLDYLMLLKERGPFEQLVAGLEAGADDYLARPFDWQELRGRVHVGSRIIGLQERLVRAREDLYDRSTRDNLTGLWNREAIIQSLDSELARASRGGTPLAIVMADIDHFKQVNDTYGHLAGDAVLREAAQRMSLVMRKYDSIGRYGGEEFLLVIPGCHFDGSLAVAERLRQAVSAEPYTISGAECWASASFGLAWKDGAVAADATQLLRQADAALYRAKHQGRNRVEAFDAACVMAS
jgi:two-component system, cell cycle response regulator